VPLSLIPSTVPTHKSDPSRASGLPDRLGLNFHRESGDAVISADLAEDDLQDRFARRIALDQPPGCPR
jgi:hypothetical protein